MLQTWKLKTEHSVPSRLKRFTLASKYKPRTYYLLFYSQFKPLIWFTSYIQTRTKLLQHSSHTPKPTTLQTKYVLYQSDVTIHSDEN